MTLEEFREYLINDVNSDSIGENQHPAEAFIDLVTDILVNDSSKLSDLEQCYFEFNKGNKAFKNMKIDAAYLELPTNTLNLLIADYNEGPITSITNEFIMTKSQLMINFFENILKGYFSNTEESANYTQLAYDVLRNLSSIRKLQLFIASTNSISDRAKKDISLPNFIYQGKSYEIELNIIDINKIYNIKSEGFDKEDIEISTIDFGEKGIPCIKAEINDDTYDAYLAVVPGTFLADIYDKFGARLLEANVRSFLNARGAVNKGIRGTILNDKGKFFAYNNGISTTAKEICLSSDGHYITYFKDLQIINGGQTTASLASARIKDNADLDHIYVQMKLTIVKQENEELIRNISKYANSQNKVTAADLNSNHPFFNRMEDFSRKIFAPITSGKTYQELWFFERARGQYEQPMMKMSKAKREEYQRVRPKDKKFTKTDLAKYLNSADMRPFDVSWGSEVNAVRFQVLLEEKWKKDDSIYNENFYKELIAKAIMFKAIERIISDQEWYQENKAYRPQLVTYTFAKFVHDVTKLDKCINYRNIWDRQAIPPVFIKDIAKIGKQVFDTIYDENRQNSNISTYCKSKTCWDNLIKKTYSISENTQEILITQEEKKILEVRSQKDQKFETIISVEIEIFNKGHNYWRELQTKGREQNILTYNELSLLDFACNYCQGLTVQISNKQARAIWAIRQKLSENGVIV